MSGRIKFLIAVFVLGLNFRFWDLSGNPAGVYVDEAHLGYTAYSLLHTGRDSYGKPWPVMTKLFGSYSSSLYSYMTVLPVGLLDLNIFSTRLVSAVYGSLLVLVAGIGFGPLAGLVVAVSPVFVFFSRAAFEANLALTLLAISLLLFFRSRFSFSALFLSLSAYAYHGEKILAPIIFILFYFFHPPLRRRWLIPVLVFILTQLPLWTVSLNPAVNRRFTELAFSGTPSVQVMTFIKNYLGYLSPDNIFSRGDPDIQRSFPDISVFYWWMIIPLILGLFSQNPRWLFLILLLGIVPGAITKDYFSTIRALPLFFCLAVIISRGLRRRPKLAVLLLLFSCLELYSNLVLLKFERSSIWGYQYRQLAEFVAGHPDSKIVIDTTRQKPVYILLAFYNRWSPGVLQSRYSNSWLADYYSHPEYSAEFSIGNLSFRPLNWQQDVSERAWLIGDQLAISSGQIAEHRLHSLGWFTDLGGNPVLQVVQPSKP